MSITPDQFAQSGIENGWKNSFFYRSRYTTYKSSYRITEKLFYHQLKESGEWLQKNNFNLEEIKYKISGLEANFCETPHFGIRFQAGRVDRINHPLILQPVYQSYYGMIKSTLEILPLVKCYTATYEEVENLRLEARRAGLDYHDFGPRNQGLYKRSDWQEAKHVIVDPGAVKKINPRTILFL